jgi:hypothetical protein
MTADWYHRDLGYRTLVRSQLRQLAEQLLRGDIGVIAAARALSHFRYVVEADWPEMGDALLAFVVIDSETDALPIGKVREMWHPSTAALEDRKVAAAEDMFRQPAHQAAHRILSLLEWPARLRSIFNTIWDPIGGGVPEDEYDEFVEKVATLVRDGASDAALRQYLRWSEAEHMGLGEPDPIRLDRTLTAIRTLGPLP